MDESFKTLMKLKGKQYKGHIEDWEVASYHGAFDAVYGDLYTACDSNEHGTPIRTSSIKEFHEDNTIVETRNSYYTLGRPLSREAQIYNIQK